MMVTTIIASIIENPEFICLFVITATSFKVSIVELGLAIEQDGFFVLHGSFDLERCGPSSGRLILGLGFSPGNSLSRLSATNRRWLYALASGLGFAALPSAVSIRRSPYLASAAGGTYDPSVPIGMLRGTTVAKYLFGYFISYLRGGAPAYALAGTTLTTATPFAVQRTWC